MSAGSLAARQSAPPDCVSIEGPFDTLYRAYFPFLRKLAVRKFGVPVDEVEDLVQDVFASYLANPGNVRDVHRYLIGAACNASRQYWKRKGSSPLSETCRPEAASAGDELIDGVIRNLMIGATLSRLGASCRDTLERFYLHGETTVSIASSRDTSPGYICRLLNYCRNRARSFVQQMTG